MQSSTDAIQQTWFTYGRISRELTLCLGFCVAWKQANGTLLLDLATQELHSVLVRMIRGMSCKGVVIFHKCF
jgi:hypothetical protein